MQKTPINILLIGLGPHSQRIYLSGLKKFNLFPKVIIDLESKRTEIVRILEKQQASCQILCLQDAYKDDRELNPLFQKLIKKAVIEHNITHVILSTEPKAHYSYLKFFIPFGLKILTDKPITAPQNVVSNSEAVDQILNDYSELLQLEKAHKASVTVQCQRRYDKRYLFILSTLKELILKYNVPISHLQINHCDGSLNMPDEYFYRENHPYKYGYGKLFHSGYHFVDLCSQLMHLNFLIEDKKPNRVCTTSSHYSPKDQMFSLDETVLEQLFFSDHYTEYYHKWKEGSFDKMGELDVYALIEFFKDEHLLTVCNLNLLQSGFSKRAWSHLPKDTYKGNGRVRHEMLNLHLGPLMNIQVHSYQAHEIKERTNKNIDHNAIGGLEHFDIYIFRNCELIGGKPLEIIKSSDIYCKNQSEQTDFLGFNESARHDLLSDFLFQKQSLSDLFSHQLTIELIHELYKTILLKRHALAPFSELSLKDFDDTTQLHRRLLVR